MERLTYDDDLFLRMECVLGVPVVNQIVWRFDGPVALDALESMWRMLAAGPIDRSVRRARVPGARDSWTAARTSADPVFLAAPIAREAVDRWIEDEAAVRLDPIEGPAWRLSATTVETGGTVVSLVGSHVVGDGGALTSAAAAALNGRAVPNDFERVGLDNSASSSALAAADVADGIGRIGTAFSGAARALGSAAVKALRARATAPADPGPGVPNATATSADGPRAMVAPTEGAWVPSTVVVDCLSADWAAAAASKGGSSNSLLVAVVLGILTGSGRITTEDQVRVALPVSTRTTGDRRANATSGVSIHVAAGGKYRNDLGAIRASSKQAFLAQADRTAITSFELLKPLMQLLPDAIVAKLAASGSAPLCLCSNLGNRGVALRTIGGVDATAVAMRSITQNTDVALLRRTGGGVSAWWNESGERATLCVTGLDPDRFPSKDHLRGLVEAEYERWNLTPEFW
ncbi:hypothetical protein CH275_16300 [Rhodococcus sp. 06-235-1A]|uniref:hypothetical protein n=1 Tax=Rhodococcus sp. 06-235-1A TaxID=2022508 RepID=UPI000B9B327C|nr:hypothetical protein [Rhodococcus sp. 06-235-1A]OZD03771.1 hypothetical protein CH275_16300 [Rhodococcus sp. 06-235-1A]